MMSMIMIIFAQDSKVCSDKIAHFCYMLNVIMQSETDVAPKSISGLDQIGMGMKISGKGSAKSTFGANKSTFSANNFIKATWVT